MICNMGTEKKSGSMEASLKATTLKAKSMALANTCGKMEVPTMVSGKRIRLTEMDVISGPIKDFTKVGGEMAIWKVKEFIPGQTVASMKVCIKTIGNMDLESTHGPMEEFTRVCG